MKRRFGSTTVVVCVLVMLGGCSLIKKPNKANIDLRKKNQDLETKLAELQRKSDGDAARVKSLEDRSGTLPTLPSDRLAKLFTTHDITLFKMTGGADLDPTKPGHEGLKVHVAPIDETGDAIKAAGAFTVKAFDLSGDKPAKVGEWTFDLQTSRKLWTSVLNRYNYVLTCPWQARPAGENLHLEVTFNDELTQSRFEKSIDVKVELPQTRASK